VIWKHDGQEGICKVVLHGKQAGAREIDCDTWVCLAAFFSLCVEVYLIRWVVWGGDENGFMLLWMGLRYIVIHNIVVTRNIFEYPNNVSWQTPDM
jgi:hypothetical protein